MDRELLNKAAITYAKKNTTALNPFGRIMDDFKSGANWLMQQTLSERLTDTEKEKFKTLHAEAALWGDFDSTDNIEPLSHYHGRKVCLEWIFGKDLFIEK